MKKLTRTFIVCTTLFACLSLFGAPPTGKGYQQSGIVGQVQDNILFADVNVLVASADGQFITDVLTDAEGNFGVDLKPGNYVLMALYAPHPAPGQPLPNFVIIGPPTPVTVVKKQFTTAILSLSIGPL
jgi:hypothetical protein